MITVENLNVYYGHIHAVKGVSFQVREGEITAINVWLRLSNLMFAPTKPRNFPSVDQSGITAVATAWFVVGEIRPCETRGLSVCKAR